MIDRVRAALGSDLRSLCLFGSCLHPTTRATGSIPDLFAVVEDARAAARAFGVPPAAAALARLLPPATIALGDAKLNLVEPAALHRALARLDDLTIAGRLSKRVEILYARDDDARVEIAAAVDDAARAVARIALRALPRRLPLRAFARRCFALSYRAEVRPETQAKIAARFDAFAAFYERRFGELAATVAPPGLTVADGVIHDTRPSRARLRDRCALAALLAHSRARSILRWPKAMLLYAGWWPYVAGKLRRARRGP